MERRQKVPAAGEGLCSLPDAARSLIIVKEYDKQNLSYQRPARQGDFAQT